MVTAKEKYIQFCHNNKGLRIFYQPWWLDCVCEKAWDVAIAEENGNILGFWPIWRKKKIGISYIIMPKFTQVSGPVLIYPPTQSIIKKQSFYKKAIDLLIEQLPDAKWINLNLDYGHTNWQPFYWNGFKQTSRYSYVIDNPPDNSNELLTTFSKSARQEIKKAQKDLIVSESDDMETFFMLNKKSFARNDQEMPFLYAHLEKLYKTAVAHGSGKILLAKDNKGNVHSGLFIVWDNRQLYYIAGGGLPKYRDSGSKFLLSKEAILFAAKNNLSVNFLGSMIEGIAYYARQFGASPVPYHVVQKINNKLLKAYFFLKGR